MLSSESDSLASGGWDNAATAFLHDRHFWTLFLNYRKVILIQIIKNTMASSYNEI